MGKISVPDGYEEVRDRVLDWAVSKGILADDYTLAKGSPDGQWAKLEEEWGEMAEALSLLPRPVKPDSMSQGDWEAARNRVRMELGDVLVCLVINSQVWGVGLGPLPEKAGDFSVEALLRAKILSMGLEYGADIAKTELGETLVGCCLAKLPILEGRTGQMVDGVFVKDPPAPTN